MNLRTHSSIADPVVFVREAADIAKISVDDGAVAVRLLIDEDDLTTDTVDRAPTQQSVKAYVDAVIVDLVAVVVNFDGRSESFLLSVGDETTDLTAAANKKTFRMPFAMALTEVRASVTSAPTDAAILVDIHMDGTTVLSTKIMIDATEKTSETATTPYVISVSALTDDAIITIDIDQIGSTAAGKGLKVVLTGTRA